MVFCIVSSSTFHITLSFECSAIIECVLQNFLSLNHIFLDIVVNFLFAIIKVTWLACWVENIAGNYKYVMLNSATKLKVYYELKLFRNSLS